jgi:hypothetical protein
VLVSRYWLMCAADEAYALNTSLVGSVGVLMSSWGATEVMKKLGVERRLFTAGAPPRGPAPPSVLLIALTPKASIEAGCALWPLLLSVRCVVQPHL